jgi:hypothetical protein
MRVDLRGFDFREGEPVTVKTESSLGATEIFVPDDVCVVGALEGDLGVINLRGFEEAGFDVRREAGVPAAAGLKLLRLDSEFTLGYLGVRDDTSRQQDLADIGSDGWQSSNSTDRSGPEEAAARRRAEIACTPGASAPGPAPRDRSGGKPAGPGQPGQPEAPGGSGESPKSKVLAGRAFSDSAG